MSFRAASSALAAVILLATAATAVAAGVDEVRQSFRSSARISISRALSVPTLVSVELPADVSASQVFGLHNISDDTFLPYDVRHEETRTVRARVTESGQGNVRGLQYLTDENHTTTVDFPLPETPDALGRTTLEFLYDTPIRTSSLQMALSQYVVRPNAVTIRAEVGNEMRTVLAASRPSGNTISFPEFTSQRFMVTLEYAQPLRFTELSFTNADIVRKNASLVFLAHPSKTYALFYDPEVILTQELGERPQFSDLTGAVAGTLAERGANAEYKPADSDHDGVADVTDNCSRASNADQKDVDANGRGDVCDDFDRDAVENGKDNCLEMPNRDQADIDRDGIGDVCDSEESRITEKYPWIVWVTLGFASLVFFSLFVIAMRRNEKPTDGSGSQPGSGV